VIEGEGLGGFAWRSTLTIVPNGCSALVGIFEDCANRLTDPCLPQPYANRHFYPFEFIGQRIPYQGTQCLFHGGQRNCRCFAAFSIRQKWGRKKMDRRDQELLDKQMRRLAPPRKEGVIVVMLATMFLVGMTLGSVLSPHESAPVQIASLE
jgi:hypothetical protein